MPLHDLTRKYTTTDYASAEYHVTPGCNTTRANADNETSSERRSTEASQNERTYTCGTHDSTTDIRRFSGKMQKCFAESGKLHSCLVLKTRKQLLRLPSVDFFNQF